MQKSRQPPIQKKEPSPPPFELTGDDEKHKKKEKQHSFSPIRSNKSKKDLLPSNIGMVEYIGYVKIKLEHADNLLSMGFNKNDSQQVSERAK